MTRCIGPTLTFPEQFRRSWQFSSATRLFGPSRRKAKASMLFQDKVVGHAGNVIAHDPITRFLLRLLLITGRKFPRRSHEKLKELGDYLLRHFFFRLQFGAEIEVLVQKRSQLSLLFLYVRAQTNQRPGMAAHVLDRLDSGSGDERSSVGDQVAHPVLQHPLEGS